MQASGIIAWQGLSSMGWGDKYLPHPHEYIAGACNIVMQWASTIEYSYLTDAISQHNEHPLNQIKFTKSCSTHSVESLRKFGVLPPNIYCPNDLQINLKRLAVIESFQSYLVVWYVILKVIPCQFLRYFTSRLLKSTQRRAHQYF